MRRHGELGGGAEHGDGPHDAEQREAGEAAQLHGGEGRVGGGDLDVDGGVVEALQQPAARAAVEIVGGGEAEHGEHAERVDDDGRGGAGRQMRQGDGNEDRRGERPPMTPMACTQPSAMSSGRV